MLPWGSAAAMLPGMRASRHQHRVRSGLTVVEVLAALVIVSVGLLGMAGTTTLSLRSATSAAQERRVLHRMDLRLALLGAGGCRHATGGSAGDAADGFTEWWTVEPVDAGAALVELHADWRDGARVRHRVRLTGILC
jgi:Tfp pilus assembly protein PilV